MVTVTVKLFSIYQEAYGRPELIWGFEQPITVDHILDRLLSEHPQLEQWRNVTRFGVNLAFVEGDCPLQDGDEVALIPPVSGG